MNAPLWWEAEAWGGNLIDFLAVVKSSEASNYGVADSFIERTVKENVRYEGRAIRIPEGFLLDVYGTLGTPLQGSPNRMGPYHADRVTLKREKELLERRDVWGFWELYSTSFERESGAESRALAILAHASATDEQFYEIVNRIVYRTRGQTVDSVSSGNNAMRSLSREVFKAAGEREMAQWAHLLTNPRIVHTSSSGTETFYEGFLTGILDSVRLDRNSQALEAFVWMSWNRNTPESFLREAYKIADSRSVAHRDAAPWARAALREALNPRGVGHYHFLVEDIGGLLEGVARLSLPEYSAALLLDPRNEDACKVAVRHLIASRDWQKLSYFTPAIGATLSTMAAEFGDEGGTIPLEWLLEVSFND